MYMYIYIYIYISNFKQSCGRLVHTLHSSLYFELNGDDEPYVYCIFYIVCFAQTMKFGIGKTSQYDGFTN